jgi:hypothetical protein
VGGGLAGADDGGAAAEVVGAAELPGVVVGFADVVGAAVVLGLALPGDALVVGAGAAELLEGAGAGGPKHPVRTSRLLSPRTLNAESLGPLMMPPWMRSRGCGTRFHVTPEG